MASRLELQPRAPWTIRNLVAAQGLAHVLPTLPVGYWQRRVAARAFALDLMPAIPRESQHVRLVRLPGMPPLWLLASTVMTWGLVPWMWRADARTERAEARAAVARVRGVHAHAHVRRGLRGVGERADSPAAHVAPARHGQRRNRQRRGVHHAGRDRRRPRGGLRQSRDA